MSAAGKGRLRVLMLGEYPPTPDSIDGGVTAVVTYLSAALAARDDIELFGARIAGDAKSVAGVGQFTFPVFDVPKGSFGLTTFYSSQRHQIARLVDRLKPDIVHAQGADLPAFLAINSGVPAIVTVHGIIAEDARYKRRFRERIRGMLTSALIERPTLRRAKSLVLISPYVSSYYGTLIKGRKFAIANPVSPAYFAVARNPQPGRILYAGRVMPRKGVLELVKAVAAMPESLGARLVVAGALTDPVYTASVRKVISDSNSEHRFELKGHLNESDLLLEFATAQALVLPSFQETAPMVIQQAMAAGIPVVASRICGIPYQIADGESGYTVEPGDVPGLCAQLTRIVADANLARRLGDHAREVACRNYMASAVAQATVDAYRVTLAHAQD